MGFPLRVSGFVLSFMSTQFMSRLGSSRTMRSPYSTSAVKESSNKRSKWGNLLPKILLFGTAFLLGCKFAWMQCENKESSISKAFDPDEVKTAHEYKVLQEPSGSELLPNGIIRTTSDLEMQSLWGPVKKKGNVETPKCLLALPVGIKQKEEVNKLVDKFLSSKFTVMLFHYDGVVDEWKDFDWSGRVIHVCAANQTKWWFAKRFLHPDIVSEYSYVFLWDEDLDVENFHPKRYLDIIQEEGLEISQPALDPKQSEVHHAITSRSRRARVHRRIYKASGHVRCYENSTSPPCTGWVEMMAPVFSRASWRCVWQLLQNDLIHAWGLDYKLGYCVQGDRRKKVGVVDAEYVVHKGIASLGGHTTQDRTATEDLKSPPSKHSCHTQRCRVRTRSKAEQDIFNRRWAEAVQEDTLWKDRYPQ